MATKKKPSKPATVKASRKAKTPVETPVVMIEQPHGGALTVGGTPGNKGGRPKEYLRARCRHQIETRNGIEFVGRVMDGSETEDVVTTVRDGKDLLTAVEKVRPKLRDRLLAFELLSDRGYGKPEQGITIEDEQPTATLERVSDEELLRILMERAVRLQQVRASEALLRAGPKGSHP